MIYFSGEDHFNFQEQFEDILSGTRAPILLVSGASGAGKSFIISELVESGIVVELERFLTRPARNDDSDSQIHVRLDSVDLSDLLFWYTKFGHVYGFSVQAILEQYVHTNNPVTIIIGDASKIEVVSNILERELPFVPIVVLRVEVPLKLALERLDKRAQSFSKEAAQRKQSNISFAHWEREILTSLETYYPVETLLNLSKSEAESLSVPGIQLKEIELCELESFILRAIHKAQGRAARYCNDVMQPKHRLIKEGVFSPAIESTVVNITKCCSSVQNPALLKGGVAVALYLSSLKSKREQCWLDSGAFDKVLVQNRCPLRPVSPDVDFTVVLKDEATETEICQILSRVSKTMVKLENDWEKPVFHSRKASVDMECGGQKISVDFIARSRIQPIEDLFTFEFLATEVLERYARKFILGKGEIAWAVPPEFLIFEKFVAGRGREIGKFDLFDAAALLATYPLSKMLLAYIVESQRFELQLDGEIKIPSVESILASPALLDSLGITEPDIKSLVLTRLFGGDGTTRMVTPILWTADVCKRLSLLNAFARGVKRTYHSVAEKYSTCQGEQSLADIFGTSNIQEQLAGLVWWTRSYVSMQVGRPDISRMI